MHFRNLSLLAVVGATVLAACAKDQGSMPIAPTGVAQSVIPGGPSCDFTTMRSDAALWFATPSSVNEKITAMSNAYVAGGEVGATNAGFDVLTKVSSALVTPNAIIGSPTAGDTFVKDVLACMSVGTIPAGFSVAGALSNNGLFEVVGGAGDPTGSVISRGTPTYGAEPTSASWAASAGGIRYLLYGYERDFSFTPETPAAVTAFELATVPTPIAFSPAIAGGICQTTATNSLLQSVNTILPPTILNFCSGISSIRRQDEGLFASITRAATGWLSPSEAFAFGVGGTGSLLTGLSPKAAVTFAPTAAGLAFVQAPFDTKRSARPQYVPSLSVRVTTANGTPVNGITVTLTVINNKGSYQSFNNTAVSTGTGANAGIATFPTFYIDKAGGYLLVANATIFGTPTKSVTSKLFNINGQ